MPQAIQLRQTGGPEVLNWSTVDNVNQGLALKDAAKAHRALEARATSGSTILTI